jgi:hypothetical protein
MTSTTNRPSIDLDAIRLGSGSHQPPAAGKPPAELCINELVAYMAGEPWSDQPKCVSPVLRNFALRLNDSLPDEPRQRLKPLWSLMVGTADDGHDEQRRELASQWLMREVMPRWLRIANLEELAVKAEAAAGLTGQELTDALHAIRQLTWQARDEKWAGFRKQVEAKLLERFGAAEAAWAAGAAGAAWAAWAAWAAGAAGAAEAAEAAEAAGAAWAAGAAGAAWAAGAAVDKIPFAKLTWEQRDRITEAVRTAVRDKVRTWLEESEQAQAIRDLREQTIDGAILLLERMCTIGTTE